MWAQNRGTTPPPPRGSRQHGKYPKAHTHASLFCARGLRYVSVSSVLFIGKQQTYSKLLPISYQSLLCFHSYTKRSAPPARFGSSRARAERLAPAADPAGAALGEERQLRLLQAQEHRARGPRAPETGRYGNWQEAQTDWGM